LDKLVLFDLDHTLLDGDSDVLWCDFLMDQGLLDRASFGQRNAAMERDYRAGAVSAQAFSAFYVSTLRGRSAAQWQPWREAFLREVVAPRIGAAARTLVQRSVSEGALVVLTTATNRFITELTARDLGLDHLIATECEMGGNGLFTGQVQGTPNMREGKVERLHAWLAARGQRLGDFESWGYSDSANDLPLLGAVQHAVAVHPDPRLAAVAAQRGWPVMRLHGAREGVPPGAAGGT
jgi:HAD superfamily hydrolase (TIGR01490 family)